MQTLEHLKAMRELLSDESRWTQELYARDAQSNNVEPKSPKACSWCLVGAAVKVTDTESEADNILRRLNHYMYNIAMFNDGASHAQLLAKLDEVIHGQDQNIAEFLEAWKDVKPEKVVPSLSAWQCGSAACAGGHLVNMPYFKALGVLACTAGAPYLKTPEGLVLEAYAVSKYLLGADTLFMPNYTSLPDHGVVTEHFNRQLEKLLNLKPRFSERNLCHLNQTSKL